MLSPEISAAVIVVVVVVLLCLRQLTSPTMVLQCIIPPDPDPKQQPNTFSYFLSSFGFTSDKSQPLLPAIAAMFGRRSPQIRDPVPPRRRRHVSRQRNHPPDSVLSKLNPDDVSFNDAIDFDEDYPTRQHTNAGEIDILWGERAWWKPSMLAAGFDLIVDVAEWDKEMMKLLKAAGPLSLQSSLSGAVRILDVALIGHFVGHKEANAFIIMSLLTELSNTLNYGFLETLGSILPYAIGDGSDSGSAGRYLDTSMMLYVFGCVAQVFLLWVYAAVPVTMWFGFDMETAQLAKSFVLSQAMLESVGGLNYWLHLVLDGKSSFCTSPLRGTDCLRCNILIKPLQ